MKSLRKYGKNRKTKRNVNKKTKRTLNKKRYNRNTRKNKIIIGGEIGQAINLLNNYFDEEIIKESNKENCDYSETCKTPESKSGQTIKLCDCENVLSDVCNPAVYKGDVLSSGSLFFKQDDQTISTEPKVMNFLAQRVLKSLIFKDEMKNNPENSFENFNELCNKEEGRFTPQKKIFMKGKLYKYTDPVLTNDDNIPLIYVSLEELLNKEKRVQPFIKHLKQLVNPENIQQPSQENTIVNNKETFIITAIYDLLMSNNNNIKDDYKHHNIYYHIIKTSCDVLLNLHSALQFHHCDPKIAQIFITNSKENGVKGLIGDFDKSTFSLNIGSECYRIILRQPGTVFSSLKKYAVQKGGTYFEQQRYHPKPKESPYNEIRTFYSSFILLFAQFEDAIYREVDIAFPEIIDNIKRGCKKKLIDLFNNIGKTEITLSDKLPYTSYVHAKLNSEGISEGFLKYEYSVDDYKKILTISSKEIKRHKTASQATDFVTIGDKDKLESIITLKDGILTTSETYKHVYTVPKYTGYENVNIFLEQ